MGTLNTTINLRSTDILPFVLDQTTSTASTVSNFVESGTKNLQVFTQEFFITGNGSISSNNCGPNGMYVFVQSPSTNKYNIKLYGHQQISEEIQEETFDGIESFATLKPGDSMIVNLSAQQNGVFAASTFGTASLNYTIADRGGEFGENILFIDDQTTSEYRYVILDSQLAETLPSGRPLPYSSLSSEGMETFGLAVSDYYYSIKIVNGKGYIVKFTDRSNSSINVWKYINSRGEIVGSFTFTGGVSEYELDTQGHVVLYQDINYVRILNFDGNDKYDHTFIGSNFYLEEDYNYTSANGSFIVGIADYDGNTGDEAFILINKDKSYVLSLQNFNSTGTYASDTSVYGYGNFVYLTIYNDNNGWYTRYQIWNTNGVLLKDVDISAYQFTSKTYYFYGDNKLLSIFYNGSGLANSNTDYLLQYNGTTNKLAGYNPITQQLSQFHYYGTNGYDYRQVYAYDKYLTNSIRPYNYNWNSGLYDADSVAITYSDQHDNIPAHVNSQVNYCDIVYLLKDQSSFTTYTFANDETKYIRIPNEGGGYNRITPSSNLIAFTYAPTDYGEGELRILAITSTGVATGSLVPELADIQSGYDDIDVKPVGDYIMYSWYAPGIDTTTYAMVKNADVKDTVELAGSATYSGVWRSRVNSLLLRSWNYTSPRNWYFNTSINRFVELTSGGTFDNSRPYYSRQYVQHSTTLNGLNDGNILLGPNGGSIESDSNNGIRLLKKGVVTDNITLPTTNGSWNLFLGSEAVFFIYQDMNDNYKYKVNVYDLDLNLKRTESLLTDNLTNFNTFDVSIGKRFFIKTYNADPLGIPSLYSYYMISLNGVAYWTNSYDLTKSINDKYWYNYN